MPVIRLDHYNIRVPLSQLQALCRFYSDVLGLTVGERPPFRTTGYWLYAGGHPLLHLVAYEPGLADAAAPASTGRFNHIALKCSDFDAVAGRLDAHGVAYQVEEVPLVRQRQIFFTDPAGVNVELNFDATS